jgi:integrase
MRMNEIQPAHIRDFLARLHASGGSAHTLTRCKTVLSAIFTTALNDQVIYFHPCTGITTPAVPKRPLRILTPHEFSAIVDALQQPQWQLLAELAVETGIRWGELAELRTRDLHEATRTLTIARTVTELHTTGPGGQRFTVKDYPKNAEYRQLHLSHQLAQQLTSHIREHQLTPEDLLFSYPHPTSQTPPPPPPARQTPQPGTANNHATTADAAAPDAATPTPATATSGEHKAKTDRDEDDASAPPTATSPATGSANKSGTQPSPAPACPTTSASTTSATPTHPGCSPEEPTSKTVRERLGHTSLRATERYLHTLPNTADKALTALHTTRSAAEK